MEATHSFVPDYPWYNLSTGYAHDSNETIAQPSYLDSPAGEVGGPATILVSPNRKEFVVRLFYKDAQLQNKINFKIQAQGSYNISDQEYSLAKRKTIDLLSSISFTQRA